MIWNRSDLISVERSVSLSVVADPRVFASVTATSGYPVSPTASEPSAAAIVRCIHSKHREKRSWEAASPPSWPATGVEQWSESRGLIIETPSTKGRRRTTGCPTSQQRRQRRGDISVCITWMIHPSDITEYNTMCFVYTEYSSFLKFVVWLLY